MAAKRKHSPPATKTAPPTKATPSAAPAPSVQSPVPTDAGKWRMVVRLLLAIAIALAAYLAWTSLQGGSVAGCGPESGCHRVLHSRWAYWFGVPVSLLALGLYAALLGGTFRVGPGVTRERQESTWGWLLPGAVMVMGAAAWFVALQVFVIQSLCVYCLATHLCATVAAVILCRKAPLRTAPGGTDVAWIPAAQAQKRAFLALCGVVVLAFGQTLHAPKTFQKISLPMALNSNVPSAAQTSARAALASASVALATSAPPATSAKPAPAAPRNQMFPVYGGLFELDLSQTPMIGSPGASNVFISLFDYTCHHCREMHPLLMGALESFGPSLAIVNLPMPLDPACNRTMRRLHRDHTNACEYARIGLAVWKAKAEAMHPYDDWVFAPNRPPSLDEARDYARQLVGPEAFDRAFRDPWIEQQLQTNIAIYETAYRNGHGSMPQLLIGDAVFQGTMDAANLGRTLREQFKIQ